MGKSWLARRFAALFVVLSVLLAGCAPAPESRDPERAAAPPAPVIEPAAAIIDPIAVTAVAATSAAAPPTATRVPPSPTLAPPTATPAPPTATPDGPTPIPTPSPRPAGVAPRVGLQVGHLNSTELPEELARFRTSTGARWGSTTESDLNYDIALRVRALLEAEGVTVDLLPATVPPGYDADAFIAIHADGSQSGAARGWKLATPWRASAASRQLLESVASTYGVATGLPEDVGGITVNMRGYYAFNYRRHTHAIARTTPAIIVEMGFMTSAADRAVLFGQPDSVARGIAEGVLIYLRQRDPNDGAALLPPDFPSLRVGPAGATMRTQPSDDARVIGSLEAGSRIFAIGRNDGWYQVFARNVPNTSGWVRVDQVVITNEQPVFPTATNP